MTDEELKEAAAEVVAAWDDGESGSGGIMIGEDPYATAIVALARAYADSQRSEALGLAERWRDEAGRELELQDGVPIANTLMDCADELERLFPASQGKDKP
jgi:hypothetical protein